MAFPNSPELNDIYVSGTTSFIWDGEKWTSTPDTGANFAVGPAGPSGATGADGASYNGPEIVQAEFGGIISPPLLRGVQPGTLSGSAYVDGIGSSGEGQSSWSYTKIGNRVDLTGWMQITNVKDNGAFDMGNGQLVIRFQTPANDGPPLPYRNDAGKSNPHPWCPVAYVTGSETNSLFTNDGIDNAFGVWCHVVNSADTDAISGGPLAGTSNDLLQVILWVQNIGGAGNRMLPFKAAYGNPGTILDFKITYYTDRVLAGS